MAKIVPGWSPSARRVVGARPASPTPPPSDPHSPPICLYGASLVPVGGEAEVPAGAISNNTGRPIEVRELRFSSDAPEYTGYNATNVAGVLRASITIGGKPVTSEPTPLWLFGRLENAIAQTYTYSTSAGPATQYVWRLSRPLVLPPRCAVSVKFTHPGTMNAPIYGRVGIMGRFADPARVTAIPYVLAWRSKFSPLEDAEDTSEERGLSNTLGKTLQIDRIIARHAVLNSGTPADATDPTLVFHDGRGMSSNTAYYGVVPPQLGLLRLKLLTSRNWPIIGSYQPLWDVFGMSGSLEVPHSLPPGDFYKAFAKYYAADPELGYTPSWVDGTPVTMQHALHLSAVGWREDVLS